MPFHSGRNPERRRKSRRILGGHEDPFDIHYMVCPCLCWVEFHENVIVSFCLLFGDPDVNRSSSGFIRFQSTIGELHEINGWEEFDVSFLDGFLCLYPIVDFFQWQFIGDQFHEESNVLPVG